MRLGNAKIAVLISCLSAASCSIGQNTQPKLESRLVPIITVDGLTFRDLNQDGQLEPFEDWRLSPHQRAVDLVSRMSLREKAGLMMHATAPAVGSALIGVGQEYDLAKSKQMIQELKINTFITRLSGPAAELAKQNNLLQEQAEHTRFAIPVTFSTDPRNNINATLGASNAAGQFSLWPDMTGLGALDDPALTRQFTDIARQEYLAVGIRIALSPQADLATEPRWPRINGTFGEDPTTAKNMAEAYVAGFQNGEEGLHSGSVMCVVKHWVGYGAMEKGFDAHNSYSRVASFSGDAFTQHLIPFEGAFKANVGGVMPTYAIVRGVNVGSQALEPVAAGFNKQLLTGLLRGKYGFEGTILSDWLITGNCLDECLNGAGPGFRPTIQPGKFGMPWGVEELSEAERYAKAIEAGVDQFGGSDDPGFIIDLVRKHTIPERRIDESAVRLLSQKFALGLFEDPYVDPSKAAASVGKEAFRHAGLDAQERSMVLLGNRMKLLPAARGQKVYLVGVDPSDARRAGLVPVSNLADAAFAVVRLNAPFQALHPGFFFGSRQHEGDLDFKASDPQFTEYDRVAKRIPTVAAIYLDRPAVLSQVVGSAGAVLANFGATDEALLAVITGTARPEGRLPFELPRSMDAVRAQASDVPHDSVSPLFPIFYSERYAAH